MARMKEQTCPGDKKPEVLLLLDGGPFGARLRLEMITSGGRPMLFVRMGMAQKIVGTAGVGPVRRFCKRVLELTEK